ncbi:MAG: CpaF family protein, partial [Acidimicrobiales bacterium]
PSPLARVEAAVLDRAKALAIDVSKPGGTGDLRRLIQAEVASLVTGERRGGGASAIVDPDALAMRAFRDLAGYGPLEPLLGDPDVWEIMINAPDRIFVRRHSGSSGYHHEVFHDDAHLARTLTKVLDDSSLSHRKLDPAEGLQDAQLVDGSRIHIVHGDIALGGHMLVNIRRFTGVPYHSLAQLVAMSMLDERAARFLSACVRATASVLFAGAPGTGKTTLMSCCAGELDPRLRVVVAEEVFETDVPLPNVAHMQTRPARLDRPAVDLRRLVSGFLRMAPDFAIVGEVRDSEALPLLMTLSSGVKGFTTIHAGSARQALSRLRFLAQIAPGASEIPMPALSSLVTEAIDVVVHCDRAREHPRVKEVIAVEDQQASAASPSFTVTPLFARDARGRLCWTGDMPHRLLARLEAAGCDARELLGGPEVLSGRGQQQGDQKGTLGHELAGHAG